jgi:hypothetical protein
LPCVDSQKIKVVRPSPDGQVALVGEGMPADRGGLNFGTGDWYLYDAVSGQRRAGPIARVAWIAPKAFSEDGRWFWGRRGDPQGGLDATEGAVVFSAATGDLVLDLLDRDGMRAGMCFFAPDGETVAVVWVTPGQPPRDTRHTIQIIDLPSGQERCRLNLPPSEWEWFDKWDGRLLWAVERLPGEQAPAGVPHNSFVQLPAVPAFRLKCWAFDLSPGGMGEGIEQPLLLGRTSGPAGSSYWQEGPGWAAYFQLVPPEAQGTADGWWSPLMARLVGKRDPAPMRVTVRVADPASGATRYEFPRPMGYPCAIAPDGRRLACAGGSHSVEVWDADPWPRWPGAVAAGVAAAAGVLALGWRRRAKTLAAPNNLPASDSGT